MKFENKLETYRNCDYCPCELELTQIYYGETLVYEYQYCVNCGYTYEKELIEVDGQLQWVETR